MRQILRIETLICQRWLNRCIWIIFSKRDAYFEVKHSIRHMIFLTIELIFSRHLSQFIEKRKIEYEMQRLNKKKSNNKPPTDDGTYDSLEWFQCFVLNSKFISCRLLYICCHRAISSFSKRQRNIMLFFAASYFCSFIIEFGSLLRLITYSWVVMPDTIVKNHIESNDIESQTQCYHCVCRQQNYKFYFSFFFFVVVSSLHNRFARCGRIMPLKWCRVCRTLAVKG